MIISIVSGTYNRRQHLQNMVQSARNCIPRGIDHEFVIIDGGSTDGSLEWLREQDDVVLIEDGDLLGAISAFTRGAYKAQGDYVVLANDDVAFHPGSITAALVHLENYPTCGAVAFEDNRAVYANYPKDLYKVLKQCARQPDGTEVLVPYAQVGMFRKWLGDHIGWWGANDEIMGKARKYGGDNFLSARVIEEGYTVEQVEGARCEDYVVEDMLRLVDAQYGGGQHRDSLQFRKRFPKCPQMPSEPKVTNPQQRRARILYLPIYEPGHAIQKHTKRGLRDALSKVGLVWEIDYLSTRSVARRLPRIVAHWQPDILLTQLHDAKTITPEVLMACKNAYPGVKVINWHGDATRKVSAVYQKLMRQVDMQLVVDAKGLNAYDTKTAYWQIGYEEPGDALPEMPGYDVVFLGNNYNNNRRALYDLLKSLNCNVGIYGAGWPETQGQNLYDFAPGKALYQHARLAIGDTFPGTEAFVSNRFAQALAAGGALVLQQSDPDVFAQHNPGLVDGEHYIAWRDIDDLRDKLNHWLDGRRESKRATIAQAGHEAVTRDYSFDAQVAKLWLDILPEALNDRP